MLKYIRNIQLLFLMAFIVLLSSGAVYTQSNDEFQFPSEQPRDGNFNRPIEGQIIDVSPPGFCWWRAGDRGVIYYVLHIFDDKGNEVYTSSKLEEPAFVPEKIFPPGGYSWSVDALTSGDVKVSERIKTNFIIAENAVSLPWVEPAVLLNKVPKEHPRLVFSHEKIAEIKSKLNTEFKAAYDNLKSSADKALSMPLVEKPDFDKITGQKNYAQKRTRYREGYHNVGDTYIGGVVPMALTYLLTRDNQYGAAVKKHLLHLTDWGMDGIMDVQSPKFDEVGLRLARALPQAYDWCYDIFSKDEKIKMENWLASLADKFLERMKKRDFLNTSGESHDGRVPGYLLEFAIALAERPEAIAWMDYGMKAVLTVFPHWAGADGGWAEGVDYALQYNDRFITPLQSVKVSTGYDLWKKPFFRKFPYFLVYCISPKGEITPFGDSEDQSVSGTKADKLSSMLLFYSLLNNDSSLRWWSDLLDARSGKTEADDDEKEPEIDELSAIRTMLVSDDVEPRKPELLPLDRAFFGIGWAALHTDITDPENDLMVLFKSSPFGPVSHSHVDQNTFAIMKGGKALAMPAGQRYPQHGSPFHTRYTRLTVAHNSLLINGQGQIDKKGQANGRLVDFKSTKNIGYALGEAKNAYGKPVETQLRHIVLIRPSLILVVDEIRTSEPVSIDWLMHGKEKFELNEAEQTFTSYRDEYCMNVNLISPEGVNFTQTDAWPIDPKEGYEMVKTESPVNQWHLIAKLKGRSTHTSIAAIMSVGAKAKMPGLNINSNVNNTIVIDADFEEAGQARIIVNLSFDKSTGSEDLITIDFISKIGGKENLIVKKSIINN